MEALLKVKAMVTGEEGLTSMAKSLGGLKKGAENASGGLQSMLTSAGGLSGALGSLVPLVSGVGLAAMAKGAIDAADNMNDLSQKTGVSVERLSQFDQAAKMSGTTLEAVGGAMVKLGRNLAESDTGPAAQALKQLGISATDANGKLKTTDQVVLDVADRFAKMPDGAQKSALAIQLFGKSGADMIPLLNGGRKAVESLSVTMTDKFAKGADEVNDKMVSLQTKLVELSVKLGTALMPVLMQVTDALVGMADSFAAMPGWLQGTIAGVTGLLLVLPTLVSTLSGLIGIVKVISGLRLAATIASWAAAAGPAMGVISAAFTGLLTFLTGTLLPALLAFFSGPVGWTVLAVAAVVAMAIAFRKPLGQFITWLGSVFKKGWDGFVDNILKKPITAYFNWWKKNWDTAGNFVLTVFKNVRGAVVTVFGAITGTIRGVIAGAFSFAASVFNNWIAAVNNIIKGLRSIPFLGLRLLPVLQPIKVPKFAEGGIVNRATLAMVGEGGESEYIIPESKMDKALDRFMVKAQGINAGGGNPTINITTGPVVQFGGEQYVTVSDMQAAMQATAKAVLSSLRNPSTRISLGLA